MKVKLIITDKNENPRNEKDLVYLSLSQYNQDPTKLEGYKFSDVLVRCILPDQLKHWLHIHLGVRIDRIIYESIL